MRTTLVIDDALYRKVKIRAAETGKTFSEVVGAMIESGLSAGPTALIAPRFYMPTYGDPAKAVDMPVSELKRLEQELADPWMRELVDDADS